MCSAPPSPTNSLSPRDETVEDDKPPEILVEMEEDVPEVVDPVAMPNLQETMCMLQMMSLDGPLANLSKKKPARPGISIPGISNIFGQAHVSRRIVWTVVVVSAIIIATIQV